MEFINKQLAIKLRNKGFNRPCFGYYYIEIPTGMNEGEIIYNKCNTRGAIYKDCLYSSNYDYYFDSHLVNKVDAPTIEQTLKWLREEKKIHLAIDIKRERKVGEFTWGYFVVLLNTSSLCCVQHYDFKSDSYEDAAIAGIEYVINNLI